MRLLCLLFLIFLAQSSKAQSTANCAEILRNGVFDNQSALNMHQRHELTKNIYCSSSSGSSSSGFGGSIGGFVADFGGSKSATSEYCSNDFSFLSDKSIHSRIVKKASDSIVSAWSACIQWNVSGVSHYMEPIKGFPDSFNYKIMYTAFDEPYTSEIEFFKITNAKCTGKPPLVGTSIDANGIPLTCERLDREKPTIAVVAVSRGGRYLKNISLPKYFKIPPPPQPIVLCNGVDDCRKKVGVRKKSTAISGANVHKANGSISPLFGKKKTVKTGNVLVNASQACSLNGMKYHAHQTTKIELGCGKNYGLIWWNNETKRFKKHEVPICLTKTATVINQIECIN